MTSRWLVPLVLVLASACSRSSRVEPIAAEPSARVAPPAADAAPQAAMASLRPATDQDVEFAIPAPAPPDPVTPPGNSVMSAGQLPGPEHPRGTVVLLQGSERDDWGWGFWEWDLATGTVARHVRLDLDVYSARLVRTGNDWVVMGWKFNDRLSYFRFSSDFRPLGDVPIGAVSAGGENDLASDGTLTLLVSVGMMAPDDPRGASGRYAASFDPLGRRVAERLITTDTRAEIDFLYIRSAAAVARGQAYLASVDPATHRLAIERYGPDLRLRARALFAPLSEDSPVFALTSEGDHLEVDVEHAPDLLEISLDLAHTRHAPRPKPIFDGPCWEVVALGTVRAARCGCPAGYCLRWKQVASPEAGLDAGAD